MCVSSWGMILNCNLMVKVESSFHYHYFQVLYSHMQIHIYIYTQHHNDTINKDAGRLLYKICSSHFIIRVQKGLLRVCVWEGAGDRTETTIFWPQTYGCQHCVFLITAVRMCHFLPAASLWMAFLAGSKIKIPHRSTQILKWLYLLGSHLQVK